MVGRKYTTFYLPLLKLACVLFKIEVYNARPLTRRSDPLPHFFFTKKSFCSFFPLFFWRCTIISDLNVEFEHVLKLQQLLCFHLRSQTLSKSSETIDDIKLDCSSVTDSSSENIYNIS